jgi:peptidoglycan-associated lipoprotein
MNMLKNTWQIMVMGSAISVLCACATTSDDAPVDSLNSPKYSTDVKTSGVADDNGFANKDGQFGGAEGGNTKSGKTSGLTGCTMTVGHQVFYFDFNKSDVQDQDLACIKVQANYLNAHPEAKVILEGYTDPRGSREYNVALGQRRADAVDAVLSQAGVNASQLRTVSYGAEKLASEGHTDADYALDRRVSLDYVQK